MKPNTITILKKLIKETVEKEVARQIKIVVKEIVNPTPPSNGKIDIENSLPKYMQEPKEDKKLSKDPVLNKILNETQGGISGEPMPTMGGGVYTTEKMSQISQPASSQISSEMPDFMKKAMSGHSAKVVKAIENKKGTTR
tara:strand:+ start:1317 stop:1736 length:420 start_codon:yes stop_codon:yes gene_type:complete